MSEQHDDDAEVLRDVGIPDEHHDSVRALKPLALAKGIDWQELLAIVGDYGTLAIPVAKRIIAAIRRAQPGQEKV